MGMSRKRPLPLFTEQLRRAIKSSTKSMYWLSVESQVPYESISRFVSKRRVGMSMSSIDSLVKVLGLRLVGDDERDA